MVEEFEIAVPRDGLPLPGPLTRARVAVVPLTESEATDGHARRVIERMTVPR